MPILNSLSRLLAALALLGALYAYFAGESASFPLRAMPQLTPLPLLLDSVAVGPARVGLPANGYAVSLTHDAAGPLGQPRAAGLWLGVLGLALAGWLAGISGLRRAGFVAGAVPVVALLTSLNADGLGLFDSSRPWFLYGALGLLGGAALAGQLLGERWPAGARLASFGALVAGLAGFIFWRSPLPAAETVLHLAAYATPAGAALVAVLGLWLGVENVRALLWFNTQAERPESRFGLLPFVGASLLYLGGLALYWFGGELALPGGLRLDPLLLWLPAVLTGGLGLAQRAPTFEDWLPLAVAQRLYWLLVAAAAAALGYAFMTDNRPLLDAARAFTGLAFGLLGAAFLLYVLLNFAPLIRQRLRVYRVVFQPRRLPFYAVYLLGVSGLVLVQLRLGGPLLDQVRAGQYNQLGDLARRQSDAAPDDFATAVLAERYYAESGDVLDRFNRPAQLGRATLYGARQQRQNEINALVRALRRQPDPKISLRLAARLREPADFLSALDVLRRARRDAPRSFALTSDLAQLFTRSNLTDSVAFYLDRAAALDPQNPVGQTNRLAFLLSQGLLAEAGPQAGPPADPAAQPALAANQTLLALRLGPPPAPTAAAPGPALDDATFALVFGRALAAVRAGSNPAADSLLNQLRRLAQAPDNAAYAEQLTFARALLLHAGAARLPGQELLARQALYPLAAGTSPTAGYYQLVLGLWQLQQRQYAAAAEQLGQAAAHGQAPLAGLPRAWALALAGQPDSARALAARLAARPPAQRPAGLPRLEAALRGGPLPETGPAPLGAAALAAAQRAEAAGQTAAATKAYQQLTEQAPFNEAAMLAAGRFFNSRHDYPAAYEALRRGLAENPASERLAEAYVLAAADAGVASLATSVLEELRPRLPPARYANLLAQFERRRAARLAF